MYVFCRLRFFLAIRSPFLLPWNSRTVSLRPFLLPRVSRTVFRSPFLFPWVSGVISRWPFLLPWVPRTVFRWPFYALQVSGAVPGADANSCIPPELASTWEIVSDFILQTLCSGAAGAILHPENKAKGGMCCCIPRNKKNNNKSKYTQPRQKRNREHPLLGMPPQWKN